MTMHTAAPDSLDACGYRELDPMSVTEAGHPPELPNQARHLESSFTQTRRLRHDGWDGEKMARFCAVLAETGVVTEACYAAGMSAQSAYALRHRDPVFASAWAAALAMGRERLADDLLARAMKGEVVQVWQNGAIVAEQHRFDNKLALAILRRLDKLAEAGTISTSPHRANEGTTHDQAPRPLTRTPALNGGWPDLLEALEQDRPHEALTLLGQAEPGEIDEVDDPPASPFDEDQRAQLQAEDIAEERRFQLLRENVRFDDLIGRWRTSFPPPAGFSGKEDGNWGDDDYQRDCSPEEVCILVENDRFFVEQRRAEEEADRDFYFASLAGPEIMVADPEALPPNPEAEGDAMRRSPRRPRPPHGSE